MKVRRRFLIALMISILLHAGVVTAPGWGLFSIDDLLRPKKAPPLDAWLKVTPKPATAVPKPAAPRPRPRPRPAANPNAIVVPDMPVPEAPAPAEVPPQAAATPPDDAPPAPEAAPSPAPAPAGGELLSMHVRIDYSVVMGERGLIIGRTVEELDNDGTSYQLRTTTGTTGLARLFKRVDMVYTSLGDIVDGRLRPRLFTIERDGKPDGSALFDWQNGEVEIGDRRYPLEPGTQDMLSVFCQLALTPIIGNAVTLPVATGKKVERYEFAVIGEEQLDTPMGSQPTLHLRTVNTAPQVTDVWLGLNVARLPVRIRHVDRDGDVYDQTAASIEAKPTMEYH
jgi:hypothetical protein